MRLRATSAAILSTSVASLALVVAGTTIAAAPAQASAVTTQGTDCVAGQGAGVDTAAARGGDGKDTRSVTAAQQKQIKQRTAAILKKRGPGQPGQAPAAAGVPVYVHVMAAANGDGNVSDSQIAQQIGVLNNTYAGGESGTAANTGFTFSLAGTNRYYNDTWHTDHASKTYRSKTRQGGANALNIWLVDFAYLGVATFPWDYASNPGIDGIRVQYSSLPGGSATNYNFGETATHEAGHWFGLYHTFQGGCTSTNDEVSDTAAQSSPSSGCPTGRDSCSLPGIDPIHNYMDYSYDTCYTEFTSGQSTRMSQMFAAYRA